MTVDGKNDGSDFKANIERFTGFASTYDENRPQPPAVLIDILTKLAGVERPKLVVDLGCGTGLSTRIWANRADKVIGVEPSDDMRNFAGENTSMSNITYKAGLSNATGLPDDCADIVTCSQSLHWMEPNATYAEVIRILRPGGVFAAYDCDWPPVMFNHEAETACAEFMKGMREIRKEMEAETGLKRWWKDEHLARMRESGLFKYTKEILIHNTEPGNAERVIGYILALGRVQSMLKQNVGDIQSRMETFRGKINDLLGNEMRPWHFSYRMRVGIV